MGEDHGPDETDAFGDGGGDEAGGCGDEVGGEEEGAEMAFGNGEAVVEEVGHPGGGDEAGGEGVDGEEEAEFGEDGAGGGRDGGPDGRFDGLEGGGAGEARGGGRGFLVGEQALRFRRAQTDTFFLLGLRRLRLAPSAQHQRQTELDQAQSRVDGKDEAVSGRRGPSAPPFQQLDGPTA